MVTSHTFRHLTVCDVGVRIDPTGTVDAELQRLLLLLLLMLQLLRLVEMPVADASDTRVTVDTARLSKSRFILLFGDYLRWTFTRRQRMQIH